MKTLSELRELFVSAREIAKEASPERAGEAAEKLAGISQHCKEIYGSCETYMERAKCRNLYESIDNVIEILNRVGFCSEIVASFFGLLGSKGASFSDISAGRAFVGKANIPDAPEKPAKGGRSTPLTDVKMPVDISDPSEVKSPTAPRMEMPKAPLSSSNAGGTNTQAPTASGNESPTLTAKKGETGFDPESFDGFIGQEHIVKRLKEELAAARKQGLRYLDHILLFGNRGLGKSTLMKIIAKELGVRFEFIDCSSFMNDVKSQRLFHETFVRIANEGEPVVIALDEIHALPGRLQTALLTLLNDRVYSYVTESGTKNVPIPEFTFIGATTDYDAVLSTIKDRCSNLIFFLEDYKRSELAEILSNKFKAMNLKVEDDDIIVKCINRCRSSIRELNAIVKGLNTKAINRNNGVVTMEMVDEYFKDRGVDEIGLKKVERKLLEVIQNEPRGSVSEETLAARLYLDPGVLTKEHEPFLLKIGFISINSKGRSLTQKAEDYLRYGYYQFSDGTTIGSKPASDGELKLTPTTEAEAPETSEASATPEPVNAEQPEANATPEPANAEQPKTSATPEPANAEQPEVSVTTEPKSGDEKLVLPPPPAVGNAPEGENG